MDKIVMTGGENMEWTGSVLTGGGGWIIGGGRSTVQVYNVLGPVEQLPDLNTPRNDHACGHYIKNDKIVSKSCPYSNAAMYLAYLSGFRYIW